VTDDEAFVRAVVAAPADDAPRLVYADWLDERGDPRGAYLREELRWARGRCGEPSPDRVITLGNALDHVWVCHVSRPPVGVCFDGVAFVESGPEVTISDVLALEQRVGHQFPGEYRAFLLNVNGGRPDPNVITTRVGSWGFEWSPAPLTVEKFFSAGPNGCGLESASADLRRSHGELFLGYIPIARLEGNAYLLLGLSGREWCKVRNWSGSDVDMPAKLAGTLGDLFDRLQPPASLVEELIRRGSTGQFIRWLETGGRSDAIVNGSGRLLLIAVRHRQVDVVRELLRRRARLTNEVMAFADSAGDLELSRLVKSRWDALPEFSRSLLRQRATESAAFI
jgi:uncharacterized protein (TIGR02996 family)